MAELYGKTEEGTILEVPAGSRPRLKVEWWWLAPVGEMWAVNPFASEESIRADLRDLKELSSKLALYGFYFSCYGPDHPKVMVHVGRIMNLYHQSLSASDQIMRAFFYSPEALARIAEWQQKKDYEAYLTLIRKAVIQIGSVCEKMQAFLDHSLES